MTVVDITLSHPLVNSGNDVELNGVNFKYAWKNFINGDPIPGKFDTVGKTNNGFENPIITVGGLWDADAQTVLNTAATGSSGNKLICQKLMTDFATVRSTTPITLTIMTGQNQIALGGRPTAGYNTAGANTLLGTIKVVVKSFDVSAGVKDSSEGQRVDYNLTFVQSQ